MDESMSKQGLARLAVRRLHPGTCPQKHGVGLRGYAVDRFEHAAPGVAVAPVEQRTARRVEHEFTHPAHFFRQKLDRGDAAVAAEDREPIRDPSGITLELSPLEALAQI